MTTRTDKPKRTNRGTPAAATGAPTADPMEQRVVAFAGELGRIAGTIEATAQGWMNRERLSTQIASVRDGAADLLKQLAGSAAKASSNKRGAVAPVRAEARGRSGGVVDAPGKKHRKPLPSDPGARLADSQAAKMRAATSMVKTPRRRGRG